MEENFSNNFLRHITEVWLQPEIQRRKQHGKWTKDSKLRAFQIIFSVDRNLNKVRLNSEVKALAKCKLKTPKKSGEPVYDNEIEDIERFELTEYDPNCGHITGLLIKGKWAISFDFIYNRKRVAEYVKAANEFLESAKVNISQNRLRPFFDECFSCMELLTVALFLEMADKEIACSKSHELRVQRLENWSNLGNIDPEYAKAIRKLWSIRSSARYLSSTTFSQEKPKEFLKIVEKMYLQVNQHTIAD